MEYHQLLAELHETEPQPNPEYWSIVSKHAKVIMYRVSMYEKKDVAQQLGMSASKFSAVLPILKALARNEGENEHARA